MNIKNTDVIWTYLAKFFNLSVNLMLLPMIMACLSDTELGLWYVFASISQIVTLFDFGFNATISRHMTYAWSGAKSLKKTSVGEYDGSAGRNTVLMADVIATCKLVYVFISAAALLVMLTAGTLYIRRVAGREMSPGILWSWFIYTAAVFLNLLYGYWSSLLQGIGAVAERNKMAVYSKVLQLALAGVLMLYGLGLLGFVLAYAVSGIALRLIGRYYFRKKTADLALKAVSDLSRIKEFFSTVWATAWKDGIVMLAQYLSTQANTLVCAYFVDLGSTSSYGIITQVGSMMGALSSSYYSAYQPQYSSLCLRQDREELKKLTCRSVFVYRLFFAVIFSGFLLAGIPLLHMIRPAMELDLGMVLAISVFYYLYHQHSLYCSMIASSNRIPYYRSFVITAAGSVTLSVVMTGMLGFEVWGLILPQLVANAVYNNWRWPRFVMREQQITFRDIYRIGWSEFVKMMRKERE